MVKYLYTLVACSLFLLPGQLSASEPAKDTDVRVSVQRAIPYLRQQGEEWIESRGCVSCHQIPFMLWSLSQAQQKGYDVGTDDLKNWWSWSTQPVNFVGPALKSKAERDQTLASNIDTINALLLATPLSPVTVDRSTIDTGDETWRGDFATALVKNQQADGSWQACGQLPSQKRPKDETTQVTVLWSLLALANHGEHQHDQEAALSVIDNEQPVSTEWWVARLLVSDQLSDGKMASLRAQLLANQHDDGGWGWLTSDASDALATGMALYALRHTGESDQESLQRAEQFLISTQIADGSWSVHGTKQASRNKSTPTADYWGTAWAVIGLLE